MDYASALTNGAMMGLSLAEIRDAAWWEYQALLWNWNDRHSTDSTDEAEAPDADMVALRFANLERMGLVTGSVH